MLSGFREAYGLEQPMAAVDGAIFMLVRPKVRAIEVEAEQAG
ncbi:hypothetical protein [Roseateles sp.]|nr:hypothetical protein [Roseateles sp.]